MQKWLRRIALAIGSLTLAVGVVAGGALVLRWAFVELFYAPPGGERSDQKDAYLDAIPAASEDAPNFVVIFFDDLGWGDLSSYGNPLIDTLRIDRAAAEGLRLTAFYSASPVCTPSRAALLTGRYPVRSRTNYHVFFSDAHPAATIRKVAGLGNDLPADEILLPEVLRAAGYGTGMVGKWHLGTSPGHLPNDFGFDSFYGVLFSNDMRPLHLYRDREIVEEDGGPVDFAASRRHEDVPMPGTIDQRLLTRKYTDEAIRLLESYRDERFLLYVSHTFPHVPHFASPEQAGRSRGGLYGDVVEDLDRSTGRILDALAELGLEENTLVLVTSDNGADYLGSSGPFRGRKGETYEGGMRVPMIARWPGRIPAGVVAGGIGMNIDVFPTLLGLAGLPLPKDRIVDGEDLGGFLLRGEPSPHDHLFYFPTVGAAPDAVRDGRFKYLLSTGDVGRDRAHLSLVDVDAEAHDVASLFPAETRKLARVLDDMTRSVGTNPRGWLPDDG